MCSWNFVLDEKFAGIVGMQRSRLELSAWLLGPPSLAHPKLIVALIAAHPSASGALDADRTSHSQAFIVPVHAVGAHARAVDLLSLLFWPACGFSDVMIKIFTRIL